MTDLGRGFDTDSVLPEKAGHNREPDRLPDETLRMREPAVPLHVWR